jgi:hypothetical protein
VWKTRGGASDAEFTGIAEKTQRTLWTDKVRDGHAYAGQLTELTLHAACSACAGDYEDPERSAPTEEFLDEEYDGEYEVATTADEKTGAQ